MSDVEMHRQAMLAATSAAHAADTIMERVDLTLADRQKLQQGLRQRAARLQKLAAQLVPSRHGSRPLSWR